MNVAEKPGRMIVAADLPEAPIADLLLYGLTLDNADPARGVLLSARRDLGLVASLAECSRPGVEFDLGEVVPFLESIGRRLEVAIELLTRSERVATSSALLERPSGVVVLDEARTS